LKDRRLRNHLEHYDERLDDWVESSPRRVYVDMSMGPKEAVTAGGIQDSEVMRLFDPKTWIFAFRGEEFNLQSFFVAISDVAARTQAARKLPQ
jgi:hypothetical protein